jgi:peptide deformylase
MKKLTIQKFPSPVLRKRCEPVLKVTEKERALFRQMLDVMRRSRGIGLAAPQIGISRCLMVVDIGEGALALANPEIVERKGRDALREGCLSVPGVLVEVFRDACVTAVGLDQKGERIEMQAEGLLARVIQHEVDHLHGKLILDYLPFQERCRHEFSAPNLFPEER